MEFVRKREKIEDEFEIESEDEAFKEYENITSVISANYSLIADELSKVGEFNRGKAVDLGTGLGDLAIEVAIRYPNLKIIGIDISQKAIDEASKKARQRNLNNIDFKLQDVHKLNFEDNSVDLVVSHGSLHHWNDATKAFSQIYRVLKPDAIAYLSDLRRDAPDETVEVIESNLPPNQAKAFVNSIRASYIPGEIEKMLKDLGIKNFSISDQSFSRDTIIKNKELLRKSQMRGANFSKLSQIIIIRK